MPEPTYQTARTGRSGQIYAPHRGGWRVGGSGVHTVMSLEHLEEADGPTREVVLVPADEWAALTADRDRLRRLQEVAAEHAADLAGEKKQDEPAAAHADIERRVAPEVADAAKYAYDVLFGHRPVRTDQQLPAGVYTMTAPAPELPGMLEVADLTGGQTDAQPDGR
jgi:hypothetical protein